MSFDSIIKNDTQLKYSQFAVSRYQQTRVKDLESDRKSGYKRHIINVDDNLKINYEIVKTIPGHLIDFKSKKKQKDSDELLRISKYKLLCYKDRLNKLHDDFVTKNNEMREEEKHSDEDTEFILREQYIWLKEIQDQLISQYKQAIQEEKRWFIKKEMLLDANIKLDLFSERTSDSELVKIQNDSNISKICIF